MQENIIEFYNYFETVLIELGIYAPIFSCILIILESLIPILPLFIFISINIIAFGSVLGTIISWICTIIGSILVFYIIRNKLHTKFELFATKKNNINKAYTFINNLNFSKLTLILAIPFTPSFAINIAAGLTDIKPKIYLLSLIIGKLFAVIFWGFIGTSLIDSIKNPKILIIILLMLLGAYIISLIINKLFKLSK